MARPALMRRLHRWISTACMLFLAWVAITGSLLELDELEPPAGLGGAAVTADAAPLLSTAQRLQIHNLLKQLHTGSIIGVSGRTLDILTGSAFAILSVTGLIMYLDLLGARRRLGRKAVFWS